MTRRLLRLLLLVFCAVALSRLSAQTPNRTALLIGIDQYPHPADQMIIPAGAQPAGRFQPGIKYPDLKGPTHDVDDIHKMLVTTRFQFPDDPAHIHILLNAQATRKAIMDDLMQYLVTEPRKGDIVVLYISAHGSLRPYPAGQGPPAAASYYLKGPDQAAVKVENTIVPYDWYTGVDDIFSRDLRHIFSLAAQKGVLVTAIIDACHSGSLARGPNDHPGFVARAFDFDPRLMSADPYPSEEPPADPPEMFKDDPVLMLSAALEDELAIDDQVHNPPHGLFTSALLDALDALPADSPAGDLVLRVEAAMDQNPNAVNQHPVLDTLPSRKRQPLFGGAAGTGPAAAAVVSIDKPGVFVLNIGTAQDIGPGSTFVGLTGSHALLRVTESVGIALSKAQVVSPPGAVVHLTDVFQLKDAVPWQRPTVNLFAGASNPSSAAVQQALAALRAANLKLSADPTRDPWTHHIAWNGSQWTLVAHSVSLSPTRLQTDAPVNLGAKLTAGALARVPSGSIVWFDTPLPSESVQSLQALLPPGVNGKPPLKTAQLITDRTQADYVVGGTVTSAGPAYAWFNRKEIDDELQTPSGMGAGCSPHSAYPLRTDFTGQADSGAAPLDPVTALGNSASALAKLYGWYQLSSLRQNEQSPFDSFPYNLVLRRDGDDKDVATGGKTYKDASEYLDLVGQPAGQVKPRWVYVIGIDCQGRGSVVWPYDGMPEARFPSPPKDAKDYEPSPARIQLPGLAFPICDPLGTDTYLLLTTATKLADYNDLNFDPVVTRSANVKSAVRGQTPLEDLLDDASAGISRDPTPVPTDWSVRVLQTLSAPDASAGAGEVKP